MAGHAGLSSTWCLSRRRALRAVAGSARGLLNAQCAAEQLEPRLLLAAVSWDGGGDGSSWSDPANWSGDRLPRPRDVVVIGAEATVNIGGKGERVAVRRIESEGSLTLLGGSLRTKGAMRIDGEINVLANTTLAAGKRLHFGAMSESDGARLVLRGASIFIAESARIAGLSRFAAVAPDELWFAGTATAPRIVLDGGDTARTVITGVLDASNQRPRDAAGTVHVFGGEIYVHGATIDARGRASGGQVRIGGDYAGGGTLPRAERVYIDHDSVIRADSKREGDGGTVIVWSDARTIFDGRISASAGRLGGDGGLIETSSKGLLSVRRGIATAVARRGEGGTWLMDPYDILIAALPDFNAAVIPGNPTVFFATGSEAIVSTTSINSVLNSGTSVTVTTAGAGGESGTIFMIDPIVKSAGAAATLRLVADADVVLQASISASLGVLNVDIQAGGAFDSPVGSINTNGGSLQIGSAGFNLGPAASLNTQGGNFSLTSTAQMVVDGALNFGTGSGNIEAASGAIIADVAGIIAGNLEVRALAGSVQVASISAAALSIIAGDNVVLGGGSGGLFTAQSFLFVHAGTDGTGTVLFNPFVTVRSDDVRLQAGDGQGGLSVAQVNAIANSPIFRALAGGPTTPASFSIRQDASITDLQIPGPSSFGAVSMPANFSLRSDDGTLTITSPAKVNAVTLTVGSAGALSLGVNGLSTTPANLLFSLVPSAINVSGTLQTLFGALTFPADVVLQSPSVSIVSPTTVTFFGNVNGISVLSVSAAGLKSFAGAIGNSAAPIGLNIGPGTAQFFSDVTAGSITVTSATTIFNSVTITATTVGPNFQSTVNMVGGDLHVRGASPQFNGGGASVTGTGVLSVAPANNALSIQIGGAGFVSSTSLNAIGPNFSRVEFGSSIQDGSLTFVSAVLPFNLRLITRNGLIHHHGISVIGGRGIEMAVTGAGVIRSTGDLLTEGGPILMDGPVEINTSFVYYSSAQGVATAGADITFTDEVIGGDGIFPDLEIRTGTTSVAHFQMGIGTPAAPFNSLAVYGGPAAAIRVGGDVWLGEAYDSFFASESPFELESDVFMLATAASFFGGIRGVTPGVSLDLYSYEIVEIYGVSGLNNLNIENPFGQIALLHDIAVGGACVLNGAVTLLFDTALRAGAVVLQRTTVLSGFDLSIEADLLNIGDVILGGAETSRVTIAPRTLSQTVSINEIDEGLWLSAAELSRIQGGLAQLVFGRADGTGELAIGNATFSDPVEFRMAGPGGSIRLSGPLTGTGNASFTFVGSGATTTLFGNITTDSQPIVFDDAVLIGAGLVVLSTIGNSTPGADIVFNFAVVSAAGQSNSLTLHAGVGQVVFGGVVGDEGAGTLGSLTVNAAAAFPNGGLVSTNIAQNWNAPVTLTANTVLSGGTGSLTINAPIAAGGFDLTLRADTVDINAALSGTGNLRIEPFSATRDVFVSTVPLGGALIIDQNEQDNIGDGWNSVTYGKDGGQAQMVVGGGNYPDPTAFVMDGSGGGSSVVIAGEISGTGNGTITVRGGGSTTHLFASIRTQGNAITIFDRVVLHGLNLKLDSTFGGLFPLGGKIEVHDDIDSQEGMERALEIDAGEGEIELFGRVGDRFNARLGQFVTGHFSRAILRGGIIKTVGQQLYQGPVNIPAPLLLSTLGAPITFEDEVQGDENLTIGDGSGETTFNEDSTFESLTIEFGSTRTFNGSVTIGTLTVLGGIVNFNADGKVGGGTLVAGTLSGTATIFIDGEFEWAGGLVEGEGLLVVRPGGVFSFGGASERTLARDLEVFGSLLWTSGHLFLRGANVRVMPGGVFDVRSSGTVLPADGAEGTLENDGLILRETPGAAAFVGLTVVNTGEVRIAEGAIKITPEGGTFANEGRIDLGPAGSLIVRGEYVQAAGATLAVRIAGAGVAQFGRLIVLLGGATLGGTVETVFVNGFAPQAGDEFRFLQCQTRTDFFAVENLEPPPPNLRADVEYDPDGARLVISPGLRGDSDNDGQLTVQDIFHFLTRWFAGDGDFDGDGETTVADIFAFLAAWFAG